MTELRRVLIAGPSMRPTLEVGDVVLVEPGARARRGDVVVVQSRGEPICHRAILVVPGRLVHQGDAPGAGLGVAGTRAVIGRAVAVERLDGRRVPLARRRPSRRALARAALTLFGRAALGLVGSPRVD